MIDNHNSQFINWPQGTRFGWTSEICSCIIVSVGMSVVLRGTKNKVSEDGMHGTIDSQGYCSWICAELFNLICNHLCGCPSVVEEFGKTRTHAPTCCWLQFHHETTSHDVEFEHTCFRNSSLILLSTVSNRIMLSNTCYVQRLKNSKRPFPPFYFMELSDAALSIWQQFNSLESCMTHRWSRSLCKNHKMQFDHGAHVCLHPLMQR